MTWNESYYANRAHIGRGITRTIVFFSGPAMEENLFRHTIALVATKHPLLRARVGRKLGNFYWAADENFDPSAISIRFYTELSDREFDEITSSFPKFYQYSGYHWSINYFRLHDDENSIVIYLNHGVSDTIGSDLMINDIFRFYNMLESGQNVEAKNLLMPSAAINRTNKFGDLSRFYFRSKFSPASKLRWQIAEQYAPQEIVHLEERYAAFVSLDKAQTKIVLDGARKTGRSLTLFVAEAFVGACGKCLRQYLTESSAQADRISYRLMKNVALKRSGDESPVFFGAGYHYVTAKYDPEDSSVRSEGVDRVGENRGALDAYTYGLTAPFITEPKKFARWVTLIISNHGKSRVETNSGSYRIHHIFSATPAPGDFSHILFVYTLNDEMSFSLFSAKGLETSKEIHNIEAQFLKNIGVEVDSVSFCASVAELASRLRAGGQTSARRAAGI